MQRSRLAGMADEPKSVNDILDRLADVAGKADKVTLGDMVEAFGHRAWGPFLAVPALIEISPIGGIPAVPTILAAIIVLFAVQMVLGRKQIWVPDFLARRGVKADKLKKATEKLRGVAKTLDRWFHGRLPKLTEGLAIRVAGAACILLALTVPPLELLPFASTAPMAAILAFGIALTVRDGVLMIVASVLALAAVGIGIGLWGSGAGKSG